MLKRDPKKLFLRYAKKGDAAALGKVFDLMAPELLGLALHLTRRTDLAEDVLQDTFLAAAESSQRFDPSREFAPWMIGILVHRARKVRESIATNRLRAVEMEQLSAASEDGRGASSEDPSKEAEADEVRTRVAAAIGSLLPPYREVVDAHLTEGLPPREIAPALGRAPGTVRVQLHRGLEQLRELLASREGIGGLEMLSLAPTSALMYSGDMARGLSAVKAELLASLPAMETAAAGAAGGSTIGPGFALAAGTTLLGAGAWASVYFMPSDTSREPDAATLAGLDGQDLAPTPTFTPVEDSRRRAQPGPPAAEPATASGLSADQGGTGSASRRSKGEARTEPAVDLVPEADTYTFRIQPSIDRTAVEVFNAFDTCRFHARSVDYQTILGEGTGVYNDFVSFSIGNFASPMDLPNPLIVHFDHPMALPCEVALSPADWAAQSGGYVARPVLLLDKIEMRLVVANGAAAKRHKTKEDQFEGEALLLTFSADGRPRIHDRQTVRSSGYGHTILRAKSDLGSALIVGIPESPHQFSDFAEVSVSPALEEGVDAVLRPRALPPIEFAVKDPFGQPMGGLQIRATVPDTSILLKDPETTEPWLIEGRVLCMCDDGDVKDYGAAVSRGHTVALVAQNAFGTAPSKQPTILAVHHRVEGATDKDGSLTLNGVVLGIHRIEAKSPLTGAWVAVEGRVSGRPRRSTRNSDQESVRYELKAPVAGLEIECPAVLEGQPEVWKKAKIQLTGGDFESSARPKSAGPARVLIPPGRSLMVNVSAGNREYGTLSRGVPPGGRHLVAPMRLNHAKVAPKGNPSKPRSPRRDG